MTLRSNINGLTIESAARTAVLTARGLTLASGAGALRLIRP
jgi:hypothetical protein